MNIHGINTVIVFEPYGLGDLSVALHASRILKQNGLKVSLICSGRWSEWIKQIGFIDRVFYYEAPWVRMKGKLRFEDYINNKDINNLKTFLKNFKFDETIIWDFRGNIVQRVFISLISKIQVVSFPYHEKVNVYCRVFYLLEYLGINDVGRPSFKKNKHNKIAFFGGAQWNNRKVPISKSLELFQVMHTYGYELSIILEPFSNEMELSNMVPVNFKLNKNTLSEIIEEIKNCSICISTDSGWLHVSYFYGLDTIGLFGFDTASIWAPPNSTVIYPEKVFHAHLRYKNKYENIQPLANLKVVDVVSAVIDKMK